VLNVYTPVGITYAWQKSLEPGLWVVVVVWTTPLIVNFPISNVPALAIPDTQSSILFPAFRLDSSLAERRFQPESYALTSEHDADDGVGVGVTTGVGLGVTTGGVVGVVFGGEVPLPPGGTQSSLSQEYPEEHVVQWPPAEHACPLLPTPIAVVTKQFPP
jgi:hypothetical protein